VIEKVSPSVKGSKKGVYFPVVYKRAFQSQEIAFFVVISS
jgi:hypothetical protein